MNKYLYLIAVVLCLSISACGGTGSSEVRLTLSLSPANVNENLVQGISTTVRVNAVVNGSVNGPIAVVITDSEGVIERNPSITQNSSSTYIAALQTNPSLTIGDHRGSITIHLCSDTSCRTQYAEASLPYDFSVQTANNLSPLSVLPGVDDWRTEGGNVGHTNFVPVALDPSKFSARWIWNAPNQSTANGISTFQSIPVSNSTGQKIYVTSVRSDGNNSVMYALNEFDGSQAWAINFSLSSPYQYPSALAVFGNVVYTTIFDGNGSVRMTFSGYDADTGSVRFQTPFLVSCPQGCRAGAVVTYDNVAIVNPGSGGISGARREPIRAFDVTTGALLWTGESGGGGGISPTFDGEDIYFYLPNSSFQNGPGLTAISQSDGALKFGIGRPPVPLTTGQVYFNGGSPVQDGHGGIVVNLNAQNDGSPLDHFNLSSQILDWEVAGDFSSEPAVYGSTIFIGNEATSQLEARDIADGHLLWSWSPQGDGDDTDVSSVVVTQNIIFASTAQGVYAIDMEKRVTVWSIPFAGSLAISPSGLLYIRGEGKIAAINLR